MWLLEIWSMHTLPTDGSILLVGQNDIGKVKTVVRETSKVYRGLKCEKGFRGNLRNLQTVQNKPFQSYYHQIGKELPVYTKKEEDKPPQFVPTKGYKKILGGKGSEILPRPSTTRFLIRRPASKVPAHPVKQEDILFKTFTRQLQFKLKNFPTTKEQYFFYRTNFPLLLDQLKEGEQNNKIPLKRTRSPENAISQELKRGIELQHRLFDIKWQIDELEREDDCEFETELRKDLFNPTKYPWNKGKRPFPPGKASKESKEILRKALWSPV